MHDPTPVVYVIKEQVARSDVGPVPFDYTPAMSYGEISFVTQSDMPLHAKSSVQDKWNEDVRRFVEAYNPETDFIICTGQPTAIFSAGFALGQANKNPRFLVWRREENKYRVVGFDADFHPIGV